MKLGAPKHPYERLARRRLLKLFAASAIAGALPSRLGAAQRAPAPGTMDFCTTPPRFDQRLRVPGRDGLQGFLRASSDSIALDAVTRRSVPGLAVAARVGGREYIDPTLVVQRGTALRIGLRNALSEPTILHWHGLTIDTANDGNGETLAAPGKTFDYAFTLRNRAGLYWYHPHPHGATAGQAYRGMFGLLFVEDDEELALRKALELVPGETEIPLVLHDRRSGAPDRYAPTPGDMMHGWYGDESLVNFTARPYLDVGQTRYRFRVLNASNARIFRLGLRNDRGGALPLTLIGTDGGLLEAPRTVNELFIAPAERVDILVDFSPIAVGGFALLESRAFDPMHAELAGASEGASSGAMQPDHSQHGAAGGTMSHEQEHAHHHATDDASQPQSASDGAPFAILQFNVRRRGDKKLPPVPAQLSAPAALAAASGDERPLRLGFAKGRWRINDRVYDMQATPIVVAKDAVETWLIRNYHTSMPHAMHLHGFQFRVLERETSPDQLAPLVVDARGRLATDLGWKDTILVWPGESVRILIDFRHPFPGDQIYLVHCHNLEHEDGGMMLRVKVG
ncbi:MAG TPA: multicopper oxidase family protein [Casimicrobiaceae bacterium]|nr:multicopper oxidase family protein [Casimicrobiaceae bacterium]